MRLGTPEVSSPSQAPDAPRRVRQHEAGRPARLEQAQTRRKAWDALGEPTTRGDPMSPLRWPWQSTRRLAQERCRPGHHVRHRHGGPLRKRLHDSGPGPRKTREGTAPSDRNAPFASIKARVQDFQPRGQPVVSGETQTQERVGDGAKAGRESQPQGAPEPVRGQDFLDTPVGKGRPEGDYDLTHNGGWGRVGVEQATADWAVATVQPWWPRRGPWRSPQAPQVLLTADGGGSHGRRARLWTVALHKLRDTTGREVHVGPVPPGTSPGQQLDQRLCCPLTETGRGRPRVSQAVRLHLMAHMTTEAGWRVEAARDPTPDEPGPKVSEAARAPVNLDPADCHGTEWNSVIKPRGKTP